MLLGQKFEKVVTQGHLYSKFIMIRSKRTISIGLILEPKKLLFCLWEPTFEIPIVEFNKYVSITIIQYSSTKL